MGVEDVTRFVCGWVGEWVRACVCACTWVSVWACGYNGRNFLTSRILGARRRVSKNRKMIQRSSSFCLPFHRVETRYKAIFQIYLANLFENRLGKIGSSFEPVMNVNCRLVAPPLTKLTDVGGDPNVAFYYKMGKQLHYIDQMRHGSTHLCHCGS